MLVVICHEPDDWLARSESGIRQYLHSGRIALNRFGVDELADILRDRARVGLVDDVVTREQLETIADGVDGVAREGIQTVRAAAEIAVEREHGRIHDADVDDAYERTRASIQFEVRDGERVYEVGSYAHRPEGFLGVWQYHVRLTPTQDGRTRLWAHLDRSAWRQPVRHYNAVGWDADEGVLQFASLFASDPRFEPSDRAVSLVSS